MYLVMSFETTPVVVGVEGPCSAVGGLETPGNLIKKSGKQMEQVKRVEQDGHSGEKVTYACLHPSSSTPCLSPIGSPLCQLRMVRGSRQPPSLENIFN